MTSSNAGSSWRRSERHPFLSSSPGRRASPCFPSCARSLCRKFEVNLPLLPASGFERDAPASRSGEPFPRPLPACCFRLALPFSTHWPGSVASQHPKPSPADDESFEQQALCDELVPAASGSSYFQAGPHRRDSDHLGLPVHAGSARGERMLTIPPVTRPDRLLRNPVANRLI